jgi:uncharacterized integral membrane protein
MSTTKPPVQVRTTQERSGPSPGGIIKLVVLALVVLAVIVFILQNSYRVEFTFLFWHFTLALWVMLVFTVVVGVLLGLAVGAFLGRRRRQQARRRAQRS